MTVFVVATAPLVFGAVQPVVWGVYAAVMVCGFLVLWWKREVDFGFLKSPWVALTAGAFLVFTLVQVVPLPGWCWRQ
ncbi:MAG: hypothetical protein K9J85_10620 [Desulfobacteraceae bacterium]|nr:hypothetical protein [Desulfobacteraceae bacterium]